jgi:histidinol-phosphate aminotransferase
MYPDASYFRLRHAIAEYNQISYVNQITVGNGSENCIECLIKAFLNASSNAIVSQYCFATITNLIKAYGAQMMEIKTTSDYRQDIMETVRQINAETKMIFVVNPNNPTGTYTTEAELTYLLDNTPTNVIVVIDEAYHEYVDEPDYPNSVALLQKYPNLVISRTFSKVFGLAGLRLGYLISNPEVADLLHRSRLPFNVNSYAMEAGIAALGDTDFLILTQNNNRSGMTQLRHGLGNLNLEYISSVANFITVDIKQDSKHIYEKLLLEGVIVRPLAPYGLPNHLRITIGTPEQNNRALNALKKALANA